MASFRDLFVEQVGASLERQLDLEESIGPCDWHLDMPGGTISFDLREKALVVPMQVLGTEAEQSNEWIAGWSLNPKRLDPAFAEASRKVKALGEKQGVKELANARTSLDELDGEKMSLVAAGLLDAPGYYRAPFSGGAMFLLLQDTSLIVKHENPAAHIADVWKRVRDLLEPAEERRALEAYAKRRGGKIEAKADSLVIAFANAPATLRVKLGANGRVEDLDA